MYSIPLWVTISNLCGSLHYPSLFSLVVPYAPSIFTVWGRPGRGQIHLSSEYRGFIMDPGTVKLLLRTPRWFRAYTLIYMLSYIYTQHCKLAIHCRYTSVVDHAQSFTVKHLWIICYFHYSFLYSALYALKCFGIKNAGWGVGGGSSGAVFSDLHLVSSVSIYRQSPMSSHEQGFHGTNLSRRVPYPNVHNHILREMALFCPSSLLSLDCTLVLYV